MSYYFKKGAKKVIGNDLRSLAMQAQKYADEMGRAVMIYSDEVRKATAVRKVYKSK